MKTPNCPDCNSAMEPGFLPDAGYREIRQSYWHRGEPEASRFLGMKVSREAVRYDADEAVPITTYRCARCGLLRSFAHAQV